MVSFIITGLMLSLRKWEVLQIFLGEIKETSSRVCLLWKTQENDYYLNSIQEEMIPPERKPLSPSLPQAKALITKVGKLRTLIKELLKVHRDKFSHSRKYNIIWWWWWQYRRRRWSIRHQSCPCSERAWGAQGKCWQISDSGVTTHLWISCTYSQLWQRLT